MPASIKPKKSCIVIVSESPKGGATDIENCKMLCKTHNRAKG